LTWQEKISDDKKIRQREACRRWYQKNKDREKAKKRALRVSNPVLVSQYTRTSYERNKHKHAEKRREKSRAQYEKTRTRQLEGKKRYWLANRDKVLLNNRVQKAKRRAAEGKFTKDDIKDLFAKQRGFCAACSVVLDKFEIDHIIPIKRGGTNWTSNLQLLCKTCNCRKGAR